METESPPDLSSLAPELQQRVRDELEPDERLIWVGQPIPKLAAKAGYGLRIFATVMLSFVLIWSIGICLPMIDGRMAFDPFRCCMALFTAPFWVVGLWLFFSPQIRSSHAKKTAYAITNKRAIIWKPLLFDHRFVKSFMPESLLHVYRTQHSDDTGNLIFRDLPNNQPGEAEGFLAIANVKAVEALVRKTLLEKPEPAV